MSGLTAPGADALFFNPRWLWRDYRSMAELCKHAFDDTATVFTGRAQIRACTKCNRVEVMLVAEGKWMPIDEYVRWRVANRAAAE